MSAVLPSPPPGVRTRPFRVVSPSDLFGEQFDAVFGGDPEVVTCVGPILDEDPSGFSVCSFLMHRGHAYCRDGCTSKEGGHVMLWRVAKIERGKSPRKLAHWDTLEAGVAMIVSPSPDADAEEKAVSRATYMRDKGRGRFQPFYAADGSLWVARLPDTP